MVREAEGPFKQIKTLTKHTYGFHDENFFFILKLLSLHHFEHKLLG